MSKRVLQLKLNQATYVHQYISVVNGIFKLTEKERWILSEMISLHPEQAFSSTSRKTLVKTLELANVKLLNNIVKSLKDKGAIVKSQGHYTYHPLLLLNEPIDSLEFQLDYV